jgi:hypothetical protein
MRNSLVLGCDSHRLCCLLGGLWVFGCGSDPANTSSGGQVTDEWRSYCVATFTSDVPIRDPFDHVAFTALAGEEYLITDLSNFGSTPQVKIAYLTPLGPDMYAVPVADGPETFPFTSNCTLDNAISYYAAYTNVHVYDSETLSNEICFLAGGTALPRDMMANAGSTLVAFAMSGPLTYEIMLNVFGARCGGATLGYVSVPEATLLGVHTWLVPIDTVMKPK